MVYHFKKLGLAISSGEGVTTFGRSLFSGGGGSLILGFTSGHKKLKLILGGHYFWGVVIIRTLRYYKQLLDEGFCDIQNNQG